MSFGHSHVIQQRTS